MRVKVNKKSPNSIDVHIGSRARLRRIELSMSQTTLANALGVTFQQVQKYEKGVNRIGGSRLALLAGTLRVPIGYFFEGLPASKGAIVATAEPTVLDSLMVTREGVALARAFPRITSAKVRRAIVGLVEQMAGVE